MEQLAARPRAQVSSGRDDVERSLTSCFNDVTSDVASDVTFDATFDLTTDVTFDL